MPPDFNLILDPPEQGILGNTYNSFVTFIGSQPSKLSSPVKIAVKQVFPKQSNLPDLTFSVKKITPSLPSGVQYIFNPTTLTPPNYSKGTTFTINVPYTKAGLYTLLLEVSGGGIVKQATVKLNVNVVNPTFLEI